MGESDCSSGVCRFGHRLLSHQDWDAEKECMRSFPHSRRQQTLFILRGPLNGQVNGQSKGESGNLDQGQSNDEQGSAKPSGGKAEQCSESITRCKVSRWLRRFKHSDTIPDNGSADISVDSDGSQEGQASGAQVVLMRDDPWVRRARLCLMTLGG